MQRQESERQKMREEQHQAEREAANIARQMQEQRLQDIQTGYVGTAQIARLCLMLVSFPINGLTPSGVSNRMHEKRVRCDAAIARIRVLGAIHKPRDLTFYGILIDEMSF